MTRAGVGMGTPAYMAPEQARGEPVDARADVFGLGAVLCTVLTGSAPFAGGDAVWAFKKAAAADLADALARLDACDADDELKDLCRRCLAPTPAGRPADGTAVADTVRAYEDGVRDRLRRTELAAAAAEVRAEEERERKRTARRTNLLLFGLLIASVVPRTLGTYIFPGHEVDIRRDERRRTLAEIGFRNSGNTLLPYESLGTRGEDQPFSPEGGAAADLARGRALAANGRVDEAEAAFRSAVQADRDDPVAQVALGDSLVAADRLGEAEASYREATTLDPEDFTARARLTRVLAGQNRFVEAVASARRALACADTPRQRVEGFELTVPLSVMVGNFSEAALDGYLWRQLAPGDPDPGYWYAAALSLDDENADDGNADAERAFRKNLEAHPGDHDTTIALTDFLLFERRTEEALAMRPAVAALCRESPDETDAKVTRAVLDAVGGAPVVAARELERLAGELPKSSLDRLSVVDSLATCCLLAAAANPAEAPVWRGKALAASRSSRGETSLAPVPAAGSTPSDFASSSSRRT